MPYLAFDLDAKKRAARAAAGLGVHPGQVAWGLLEMWEHAWEAKSETIDALTLACCFGPDPRVPGVLGAMGFIEPEGQRFRVKGADRYLRISEARRRGGLAAKGNLIPNAKNRANKAALGSHSAGAEQVAESQPSEADGDQLQPSGAETSGEPHSAPTRLEPSTSPGSHSALTPSTEHREEDPPSARAHVHARGSSPLPVQADLVQEDDIDSGITALKAAWNETTTAPLPRWDRTPKHRRTLAGNALKRRALSAWREVFTRIERSKFLRGENERGWVADIDWALRPGGTKGEPAESVLEGKYDARARATGSPADRDFRKGRVGAEEINPKSFEVTGDITDQF